MYGETSKGSVKALRESFAEKLASVGAEAKTVGDELFDLAAVLDGNRALSRALTDPAYPAETKVKLVSTILQGKATPLTVEIAEGLASQRWSKPADIADATEDLAVDALLSAADVRNACSTVSIELSELASALLTLPVVRQRLSDAHAKPEVRVKFLKNLLKGQALDPVTMDLAEHATRDLRNRRFLSTINWLIGIVASHRNRSMVTVTSAVPLKDEQFQKIKAVYAKKLGRQVFVNSVVDPRVLGGMRIQVGSEVTDNTVAAQLQNLKRAVA
ncbi:F0F1 ATP synthase subunit delta [Bifidobacterium sp. 82T24]|uniref:F0F1 ATP synthase subunit delta n=1 Tax=Bifidobacterium pluvialisilvae TaxID=2834436 RepID=UPI001C59A444|nr:F0F1 ATP synthase subunit delta [Bifidobacterium pluvialisilvae]MBW3087546.1 F0F1 ATP synthase subunit delta [Bifidobacterium pluvialisilvae]